ncbi:MAG: T9SS type A sorting domain-containing protein [bacterium]|nr:T9SS type A sorting domain-containing protein [bacterium]
MICFIRGGDYQTGCESKFAEKFGGNYPCNVTPENFAIAKSSNWSTDNTGILCCGMYNVQYNDNGTVSSDNVHDHLYKFTNGGFDIRFRWIEEKRGNLCLVNRKTWHFTYADFVSRSQCQTPTNYYHQDWKTPSAGTDHTKYGTLPWLTEYELLRVKNMDISNNVILFAHNLIPDPTNSLDPVLTKLQAYKGVLNIVIIGHVNCTNEYSAEKYWGICPGWTADNFGQLTRLWGSGYDFTPTSDELNGSYPFHDERRFTVVEFWREGGEFYTPTSLKKICPIIHSFNGTNFVNDNTILPSTYFGLNWDDFCKLETTLQLKNGKCVFRVYGNTGGNTYLDQIRLIAIDHSDSTIISTTPYGEIMHHASEKVPDVCLSDSGYDVKFLVSYPDTEYETIPAGGYVEANFGNVTDTAYSSICITGENNTDIPLIVTCGSESLATIFPREKPSEQFINLEGCKAGGTGNLVLRFTAVGDSGGKATINKISYCTRVPQSEPAKPTGDIEVTHCNFETAIRYDTSGSNPRDVTDELSYQDGIAAGFTSNNYVEFTFTPPESALKSGYKREYIIASSGEATPVPQVDTVSPNINVIYPNGGEIFAAGDTYSVSVYGQDNVIVDSVRLSMIYNYEIANCDTYYLGSIYPNELAGEWSKNCIIPNLASSNACRILATGYDGTTGNMGSDTSDNNFSIKKGKDYRNADWIWTVDSTRKVMGDNWNIKTLRIESNAVMNVQPFDSSDSTGWLVIEAKNARILGILNSDTCGYLACSGNGAGIIGSTSHGASGSGFAGRGGNGGSNVEGDTAQYGGAIYGDSTSWELGSGGGNSDVTLWAKGGRGAGKVKLICSDTLTITGKISSDGQDGKGVSSTKVSGAGSGGSIALQTTYFEGSGTICANGGEGITGSSNTTSGGGSGGRIYAKYIISTFDGRISANGGTGPGNALDGQCGSILLQGYQGNTVFFISPVQTNVSSDSREAFIKGVEFPIGFIKLSSGDSIVGNMTLGATDSIVLGSSSYLIADNKGYAKNQGTGYGHAAVSSSHGAGGAGYGNTGGHGTYYTQNGTGDGGIAYGDTCSSFDLGSGGGNYSTSDRWGGGSGGGKVKLDCSSGKIVLNGTISVNGENGISKSGYASGGGSGGSILIMANYLSGNGTLNAKGGNGGAISNCYAGGGSGGRVTLLRNETDFSGTVSVTGGTKGGGTATDGGLGTICIDELSGESGGGQGTMSIPRIFKLYQNYPNPTIKQTTIMYQIPVTSKVSLKLYDLTGRCVKTLVDGEKVPGYYKMNLNSKDYPAGVYFAKFNAKGGTKNYKETKKLVLMK